MMGYIAEQCPLSRKSRKRTSINTPAKKMTWVSVSVKGHGDA